MSITLLVASHSTPGSSNIIVGNSKAFVFQSMKFTSHAVPPGMFTSVYSCGIARGEIIQRLCVLAIISCQIPSLLHVSGQPVDGREP